MFLNSPCIFLKKIGEGCGDYDNRPENPCKLFKCGWLQDDDDTIPYWMKPDISNVIIIGKYVDGEKVLKLVQCGDIVKPNTIAWFFKWASERTENIEIALFNNVYYYGDVLNRAVLQKKYIGGI